MPELVKKRIEVKSHNELEVLHMAARQHLLSRINMALSLFII